LSLDHKSAFLQRGNAETSSTGKRLHCDYISQHDGSLGHERIWLIVLERIALEHETALSPRENKLASLGHDCRFDNSSFARLKVQELVSNASKLRRTNRSRDPRVLEHFICRNAARRVGLKQLRDQIFGIVTDSIPIRAVESKGPSLDDAEQELLVGMLEWLVPA